MKEKQIAEIWKELEYQQDVEREEREERETEESQQRKQARKSAKKKGKSVRKLGKKTLKLKSRGKVPVQNFVSFDPKRLSQIKRTADLIRNNL